MFGGRLMKCLTSHVVDDAVFVLSAFLNTYVGSTCCVKEGLCQRQSILTLQYWYYKCSNKPLNEVQVHLGQKE